MANYRVIDLETSIKNRGENAIGSNKASPFHSSNRICYYGDSTGNIKVTSLFDYYDYSDVKLLVGANIKFDLLYLMRYHDEVREWLKEGQIWDIQLAEYLLTAQQWLYPHLGDKRDKKTGKVTVQGMATKYGGVDKDSRLTEMWDNNVDTEDIDPDIILPYLKGDVDNTELVFKAQVQYANELEILPFIMSQMEALLATTEMEFNGMEFDKEQCVLDAVTMRTRVRGIHVKLSRVIADTLNIKLIDANPSSNNLISLVLFGGNVKEIKAVPVLNEDGTQYLYKTGARKGQVKTKLETVLTIVDGFGYTPKPEWLTKKAGVYQVGDDVLRSLPLGSSTAAEFITDLSVFRGLSKDLKTYYEGYSELCWPDGRIHPQFNHCATATGRLSHSSPNLGNVSHSKED